MLNLTEAIHLRDLQGKLLIMKGQEFLMEVVMQTKLLHRAKHKLEELRTCKTRMSVRLTSTKGYLIYRESTLKSSRWRRY